MRRIFIATFLLTSIPAHAQWQQWGRDPQHTGVTSSVAQPPSAIFANYVYDPFVAQESFIGGGDLLAHFQAPLVDGIDIFMEVKSGVYDLGDWQAQTWNVANLRWTDGQLVQRWITPTDWKPVPSEADGGPSFEPVFHAILANNFVYMPALGGTVDQVDRNSGAIIRRINPFPSLDATIYVAGPLSADSAGNIIYNTMQFDTLRPWTSDMRGSWLVKIAPSGTASRVAYTNITPNAPRGSDMCLGVFTSSPPWPPSPNAVPPSVQCGAQRPGLNVAPAIAIDGTIYTVSRAQFVSRTSYLVAVNPDLTPKWNASLRDRLNDGCNVLLPPNGTPGGCRNGALTGVDPADNTRGAGRVNDDSTSSPVVAPDGSIYYGAFTRYNYAQGHMMHFSATGEYLGAYRFGWDVTPAIWSHGQSYSVITKENHYASLGSYCDDSSVCPEGRTSSDPEQYTITRLSPSLDIEWQFKSTNTKSCRRVGNTISCVDDHPNGFEWCVNAPAVDANGATFVNSEDGFLYAIDSSGRLIGSMFLQLAIGAAYTPLSIDAQGRVYTQNAGHMFVVGAAIPARRRAVAR